MQTHTVFTTALSGEGEQGPQHRAFSPSGEGYEPQRMSGHDATPILQERHRYQVDSLKQGGHHHQLEAEQTYAHGHGTSAPLLDGLFIGPDFY